MKHLAAFVLLGVLGCQGPGNEAGSQGLGSGPGLLCDRDREVLHDLLVHPRACTTSPECPAGSFCDATSGSCDWDCFADSDCGAGATCSCDGHCGGPGSQPAPTAADLACPRDRDVLASLAANPPCASDEACPFGRSCDLAAGTCRPRDCVVDQDCPAGASCDPETATCHAACYDSEDPQRGCPTGLVCDCLGTCVVPGLPRLPSAGDGPRLEVSAADVDLEGTGPLARRFSVSLRSPTVPAVPPRVHARAPQGFRLERLGADGSVLEMGTSLVLTSWTFTADGSGNVASTSLRVSATGAGSAPEPWEVDVRMAGNAGERKRVLLSHTEPVVSVEEGEYAGEIWMISSGPERTGTALERAIPATLPVTAFVANGFVLAVEPGRTVTETGVFGFSLSPGQSRGVDWARMSGSSGSMSAALRTVAIRSKTGRLDGEVAVALPGSPARELRYGFHLSREAPLELAACGAGGACETGRCETSLGRCVVLPSWEAPGIATNSLGHQRWDEWVSAAGWLTSGARFGDVVQDGWAERLYCLDGADGVNESTGAFGDTGYAEFEYGPNRSLPNLGDRGCSDGRIPAVFEIEARADRAGSPRHKASDLLAGCLVDLARPVPQVTGSLSAQRAQWLGAEQTCVELAQLFPLLRWLATGGLGDSRPAGRILDPQMGRLLQRKLWHWLELHGFLARQGREERELDSTVEPGALAGDVSGLLVDQVGQGLDLLLDRRVASRITALPESVLRSPNPNHVPGSVVGWSFEPAAMSGANVLGPPHLVLPGAYTRVDSDPIYGIQTDQTVTLSAPAAAMQGHVILIWRGTPGAIAANTRLTLTEYGDATQLLYRFGFEADAAGAVRMFAEHGSRATPSKYLSTSVVPITGSVRAFAFSRDARRKVYTFHWGTSPSADPSFAGFATFTTQPPATLAPASEALTLRLRGFVQSIRFWNASVALSVLDPWFPFAGGEAWFDVLNPDAGEPLGTVILETTAEYLRTLEAYLRGPEVDPYRGCGGGLGSTERQAVLDRFGDGLRRAAALEALARTAQERASWVFSGTAQICALVGGTVAIRGGEPVCVDASGVPVADLGFDSERHVRALSDLAAARQAVTVTGARLARCANQVGIPEDAVPLFFGDPTGSSSRFFAASDYLLGLWVRPALGSAQSALDEARSSWLARRNADIQALQTEQDRARRLEGISVQYGGRLASLCGLDDVPSEGVLDAFATGTVTVEGCFRPPGGCTADRAECFRGEVGTAALAITAAHADVLTARSSARDLEERYEKQSRFCSTLQLRAGEDAQAMDRHASRMQELRNLSRAVGLIGGFLGGIADAVVSGNPAGIIDAFTGTVTGHIGDQIESAERRFQQHLQKRSAEESILACFHEADMIKVGLDTAYAEVQRRMLDIELGSNHLLELYAEGHRVLAEGTAARAREEARAVPSVAHHHWLDEKVERYRREMSWARRLVFLTVLAVEHELQQSLDVRGAVLTARNPEALAAATRALEQEIAGRTLNGRRPEESSTVLSLRDDVLQLGDRAGFPVGERLDSPDRRFGQALASPAHAIYDDDGRYLGQGLRFTVREEGVLALRCAERLWHVAATVQGDGLTEGAPGIPVILLKRNTFASQWCDGHGDGQAYQVGAVYPSAQLFRPEPGGAIDTDRGGHTAALLFPWFNIRRGEFYKQSYLEGASDELAGRGLYGEYILLFPEAGTLNWTQGDPARRFPLERVEDVLVRFDYLSIDDLQGL